MDLDLVQAQVKYVTPEMAAQWLRSNTANRKPSKAAIKRWAQIMRAHAWKLCSDAIAFDVDGVLINGQHRLMAVIETGMTQPFLVANNFPAGSKEACDIGKKRQLHEILTIGGYEINQMHAAVCRFLLTPWEQAGAIEVDHDIHRNRIKKLHRELKAKINFIEGCIKGKEFTSAEIAAITALSAFIEDNDAVADFINLLQHGVRCDNTRQPGDIATVRYREFRLTQLAKGHRNVGMKAYRLLSSVAYKHAIEEPVRRIAPLRSNPFEDFSETIK